MRNTSEQPVSARNLTRHLHGENVFWSELSLLFLPDMMRFNSTAAALNEWIL